MVISFNAIALVGVAFASKADRKLGIASLKSPALGYLYLRSRDRLSPYSRLLIWLSRDQSAPRKPLGPHRSCDKSSRTHSADPALFRRCSAVPLVKTRDRVIDAQLSMIRFGIPHIRRAINFCGMRQYWDHFRDQMLRSSTIPRRDPKP